jgi:hypothetical protein
MRLVNILVWFSLVMVMSIGPLGSGEVLDVADLGQYHGKNRVLLLFSLSPEHPAYQALGRELQEQAGGVRERDLVVFHVLEAGKSFRNSQEISPTGAKALRQRFRIEPGAFTVVLVGKDGGVKLKRTTKVALADIFGLIDSMPMRQQEMLQQK